MIDIHHLYWLQKEEAFSLHLKRRNFGGNDGLISNLYLRKDSPKRQNWVPTKLKNSSLKGKKSIKLFTISLHLSEIINLSSFFLPITPRTIPFFFSPWVAKLYQINLVGFAAKHSFLNLKHDEWMNEWMNEWIPFNVTFKPLKKKISLGIPF